MRFLRGSSTRQGLLLPTTMTSSMMLDDKDDGGDKDNTNKGWGYVDDNKIDNKDLVSQTITTTRTERPTTTLR